MDSGQWAHPQREDIASHCHLVIESARANSHYICGELVATSAVVRYLGFVIDADLSMAPQVANACRSAYYHLARIAQIRDSITTGVCKCPVHAFVTSRIDYGNAMLCGIPNHLMHCLEMVQRSAARIILQIRRGARQSMSEVLSQLHWFPVRKRTESKLLVLVHCALYEGTPVYLALLTHRHTPRRSLRSAGDLQPRTVRSQSICVRWPNAVEQWESRTVQKDIFIFKLTSMLYTT